MPSLIVATALFPLIWTLEALGIDAGVLSLGPWGAFLRWIAR